MSLTTPKASQLSKAERRALLAQRLKPKKQKSQTIPPRLSADDAETTLPLSFAQERLWFLEQFNPQTATYNIPVALRLRGPLNQTALQQSFTMVAARHAVLRTAFINHGGAARQNLLPRLQIPLSVTDLQPLPAAEREKSMATLMAEEAAQPFTLSEPPLLRTRLLRLSPTEHVLLLTIHHIIADGWSFGVLFKELSLSYTALLNGAEPELPSLPVQYADYGLWQREAFDAGQFATQIDYWREQLAKPLPVLELPISRTRPRVQTYHGAVIRFELAADLVSHLQTLSHEHGATMFMSLLATFKVLLFRYSGQTDLLIGSPVANRLYPEVEPLLGFFINNLVLRSDLSGAPTFKELLQQLRQTTLAAYEQQGLPFDQLVELLQPERDPSRNPLFQVMFALQNMPTAQLNLPELAWALLPTHSGTAKFDMALFLEESHGSISGLLEYNTDLFTKESMTRLMAQYTTLLQSIVADPNQPITTLPLLPEEERQQLLHGWNQTKRPYPHKQTVYQLFAAQVQRTPTAPAVILPRPGQASEQLSYMALEQQANQLAHFLQAQQIGPGSLVGLCVSRTPRMLVALLGILKAGAAYVPLDPNFPAERLGFMIADAGLPLLLTESALQQSLPMATWQADNPALNIVDLNRAWPQIREQPHDSLSPQNQPNDLAYIIYTSGSTGKPKGVQIPHRGLTNFLWSMAAEPGLTAQDTLLAVTTLSFDIAALELYLPLLVGARVVLAPQKIAMDGAQLLNWMQSCGITVLQATPATWHMLLEQNWSVGCKQLKILCGGEAMPPALARQLLNKGAEVWNLYGPTETTIWSTVRQVTVPPPAHSTEAVSVGRPIANTQIYILDEAQQPTPVGVPGLLYIGGDGLARGYLNRPQLTAERFVPSPFAPEKRLYNTGDMARYLPDGTIEFLGRVDFQVKVRGFRIELGEIEAVLNQHGAINQAVVVVREDRPGDKRLVAYLMGAEGEIPPATALRAFLKQRLPDYMIPSLFIPLAEFPLTPNRKVDRRALPAPEASQLPPLTEPGEPPQTVTEQQLAQIWQTVLNLPEVSRHDNFFDLGGHSLLAVRLLNQIEQEFGRPVPLNVLFQAPTVAGLAEVVQGPEIPAWSALMPIQPQGQRRPFFCLGGGVALTNLARHLNPQQPLYGLEILDLEARQPLVQVEEIAAAYLLDVRAVQPQGPYLLGGFCFGGQIAYEMAQQLHAAGEQVALLALFEAHAPERVSSGHGPQPLPKRVQLKGQYHLQKMARLSWAGKGAYLGERLRNIGRETVGHWLWRGAYRLFVSRGRALPPLFQDIEQAHQWAAQQYQPQPYVEEGRVVLFPAAERLAWHDDNPKMGWEQLITNLAVHQVAGEHVSIFEEPHVQDLAQKLEYYFDELASIILTQSTK